MNFPILPECISKMIDLEERMVSPILNFMQIRALKPYALNSQWGLKGSVVNIMIDVNEVVDTLPRKFNEMNTIQIKLKRHIDHKSDYMFETIRPGVVCEALNYLIDQPLYKKHNIEIDENFFKRYEKNNDETIDFVIENDDKEEKTNPESDSRENEPKNNDREFNANNNNDTDENKDNADETNDHATSHFDFSQINNDEVLLMNRNAEATKQTKNFVKIIAPGQNKTSIPMFPKNICWSLI